MPFDKGDIELHLRLLNKWKVGNPSKPDQFYAFGTLWTDAEVRILLFPSRLLRFVCGHPFTTQFFPSVTYQGTVIEANSHRVFTDILADKLNIGDVYILTRFTLDMPRKAFRTCSFPRLLVISPSSLGGVVRSPPPTFPTTAFELVPFEDIDVRQSPCPYLSGLLMNIDSFDYHYFPFPSLLTPPFALQMLRAARDSSKLQTMSPHNSAMLLPLFRRFCW
ncbi:hypothetical protein LINPERHAP1_LOCUS31243 [Linum perenne]